MRKILSILMAVLFVGVLFATPSTSTLTFTTACGGTGTADDEAAWTITSDGTESTYDATKGIHYGTGSSAVGYIQLATSDIPGTITQVVVNASTANGVSASVTVKVGTTDFKTTGDATSIAATTTATDYTFAGSASGDIVVRLAKAASANKALYVKSVAVTYTEGGSEPTTQTLYLKISSDWEWPSKYAVYYFEDGKDPGWSSFMTAVDGVDNTYTTTIPLGYTNVIFVRFNSAKESTGNWDDKWSQTVDLTIPAGKNHFTITSRGTGSECNGVWNVYPVVPTYYVKGTFVDDWATAYELEEGSYTFENLDAKWYAMKVTDGASEWYGIANLDTENSSKYIYGSDNIEFTLKEKGNVTVAFDSNTKKITVTGNFVAKTTTFTVNVPEGTDSVFVAGSWDGWAGFHKMEPVLGEDDQFKLTIDGEYADLEYKYLAGPNWKYAEDREDNRTWAALDNVIAWKAVPSFVKFAKVKAAPVNWTGHYIIAWGDLKPRSVVDATSTKDLVPADGAPVFVDGDTISVLEGSDYAVEIRFSETTGAYTVKLSDSKYLKNVSKAVNASDAAADLYLDFYKSETKEGVRIANADPADAASFILYKQNSYFRAYAGKIEDANYSLPTLYRLVDEPFDCLDGPYALLVNGKDIIPATKEAKEGYDEYAMYASLVKGDSVQVLNTSCGGLWLPTLEEAGAASHFAKGVAAATVDSTGCYDFYFKQIPSDQKMYIGFGICPDDTIRFTVRGKGGILGEDFEKAFDSKQDTLELDLEIGKYELKVQVGEDWKGFEQLTDTATGLTVGENGNICFQLKEAGNVKVVYNDSVFVLLGNFVVEIPHYFIAGTMTNWKDEMVELLPLEEKADSLGVSLNLKADSLYLYKIVRVQGTDTAWYGLGGDATMEYGNSTGWYIYKSEGDKNQKNVGLQTTKEAVYPFVLKVKEDHLEVSVTIPARYYAKYAPNWEWAQLIEKEGKWLTDTIVYAGIGVNINVKASDEGNMFFSNTVEEEGVRPIAGDEIAELDTVQFSFNPVDTTLTVSLISKYVAPAIHYYVAGTMTNWKDEMVELLPLEEKTDSLGVSLNLKADSLYLYKIVRVQGTDTAWYGLGGDATMEYGNSTGWYIYKSEGDKNQKNVGLQTTKEAVYPFVLKVKEDHLEVSVTIPARYYAKYAPNWEWAQLIEKEGKWLTDTIVYYGGGMNIHSAAEGDGKYFAEIAGVAAKDTAYFSFNPEDSTLVATVVGKYIKPFPVMQIAGQWDMEGENWIVNNMVLAADSLTATYEVSLEKGDYEFKLIKDGKWITKANGGEPYGLHRTWPGVAGVVDEATENLKVTADVAGKYLFTWTFANDSIGITFPDKPEPKLTDGYYLVGKFSGVDAWSVEDLSAAKLFAVNPENDKEYQLNITLAVEDSLKVVYVAEDVITTWFPAEGDNYGVDANHAGATTIYFRPDYQGGEDWFAGCLYVVPTSTVDIEITNDGVQAIKVLRNGQILIIKGEKTYNALGILVE